MRLVPSPLFILHGEARFRARVEQAAGKEFAVHRCGSWAELHTSLRRAPGAAIVVVDAFAGSTREDGVSSELQTLLHSFPFVPVIAVVEFTAERLPDVLRLGSWGVADVLPVNEHGPQRITSMLRAVRARSLQQLVERLAPRGASGRAISILREAADISTIGGHAADLARRLHVSKRTLLRWCHAAHLPPPKRLLPWMRILRAAQLLDNGDLGVERVALICGYAHESALRRVLADFMGTNPRNLSRAGALETATRAFQEELQRIRG